MANITKMYLHYVEGFKVIDITLNQNVVEMYHTSEIVNTDTMRIGIGEFRNTCCCGTGIKELTEAMSYLDADHPLVQRYADALFLGAEVTVECIHFDNGDTLPNGREATRDMILRNLKIVDITSKAKDYINNPKGLRLDLAKDDVLKRMAEEELGL